MLSVHELAFDYEARPLLRDIDFSVEPGMVCGLLGPNASGKTTLFKCISGILKPKKGRVLLGGKEIGRLSRQAIAGLVGVVPQHTALPFSFSVLQMVVMGRVARRGVLGKPSRKDLRDAETALDEVGAGHLKGRAFNLLSGGERQIVLLARALFQEPAILLLDEPTAHLDFRNQFVVMDLVRTMTRFRKLATLVTLHDPNLAAQYCTRMVMIKNGRIERKGALEDVFHESALESMYGMKVSVKRDRSGKCFVRPAAWGDGDEISGRVPAVLTK